MTRFRPRATVVAVTEHPHGPKAVGHRLARSTTTAAVATVLAVTAAPTAIASPTAIAAPAQPTVDQGAPAYYDSGLAPTPYMGWNTYYGLGAPTEKEVRAVAEHSNAAWPARRSGFRKCPATSA